MEQDFRALARRHMWLSWWWGLLLVWAGCAVFALAVNPRLNPINLLPVIFSKGVLAGTFLVLLGTAGFLGLPALIAGLLRWPLMKRVFTTSSSMASLLIGSALVFEATVTLCWLLWELYTWIFNPLSIRVLPHQHFVTTTLAFFGLSLPWLVSSMGAAWWLGRSLFRR